MKAFIKELFFIIPIFFSIKASAQQFLLLERKDLKNISGIANLSNTSNGDCASVSADSCGHIYTFYKGRLTEEFWYSNPEEKANNESLKLVYNYKDSTGVYLQSRWGNLESGPAQQQYYINYQYRNKKLIYAITGSYFRDTYNDLWLSKYYYFPDGRLRYRAAFQLDEHGGVRKKKTQAGVDTVERSVTYYMYLDKQLIGYFPAKDYRIDDLEVSDSIYSGEKIAELKQIGIESFSKKYFNKKQVYNKVIDDCYTAVSNKQLLVNGKPVRQFLTTMRKREADHIVFEIADNYFIFFRITD